MKIEIKLTENQRKSAKAVWNKQGKYGSATFGQCLFGKDEAILRLVVFTPGETKKINDVLHKISIERDKKNGVVTP